MRKQILLPTDFSENAWNACLYALEFFKDVACDFIILNSFTALDYQFERTKVESERGLMRILRKINSVKNNPNHSFKTVSDYNKFLEAVKSAISQNNIDLVVMGTRGESNFKGALFGSNAITAMEKVRNCPILVIGQECHEVAVQEIVFPTDYKKSFDKPELNHLIEMAKMSKASIRILHIEKENELAEQQLSNKAELESHFEGIESSFHTLSSMDIATAINCFVESRESDMVAFMNSKHAFFGSILTQPLVKEIGYRSKVPILVMHN
ncbi:MAG: universal stress protein [Flavobacteriaceae bacterium]